MHTNQQCKPNTASLATENKQTLVHWSSKESQARLHSSNHKQDFFELSMHYQSQENKMFCGVASVAIILNALRMNKENAQIPLDTSTVGCDEMAYMPEGFCPHWNRYTQRNVLAKSPKSRIEVFGKPHALNGDNKENYGLTIYELADLIECNGAIATPVECKDLPNYEQRKQDLIKVLDTPDQYIIAHFSRPALNQNGNGHLSPLVAYDQDSDSFLLMDTNTMSNNWVWIDANKLLEAMNTFDNPYWRGYMVVSD